MERNFQQFHYDMMKSNQDNNEAYFVQSSSSIQEGDDGDLEILFTYLTLVNNDSKDVYFLVTRDKKFILKIHNSLDNDRFKTIFIKHSLNTPYRCFSYFEERALIV